MKKLFTLVTGYIVAVIGANSMKKFLLLISFIFVMSTSRAEFTSMLTTKGEVKGFSVPEEFYHKFKRDRMLRANDANSASILSKIMPEKNLLPVSAQSLYGYLYFSGDDSNIKGIYEIDGKNLDMLYIDDLYGNYWITPINGWYRNGRICGLTMVTDETGGYIFGYIYYELDFETGALVEFKDLPLNPVMFMTCTLNPENDTIYGYIIDLDNYKFYWGTTTLSNPHENNIIQEVTGSEC